MAKLTLHVDDGVIARARQFAKLRGVSVSEMVENYLALVVKPASGSQPDAPVLRSIRGILKHADFGDYRGHLTYKYR